MKFKYIYGPVNSRRLGKSLGIDLLPFKTCVFNCVFCQLGRTEKLIKERREYVPFNEVIEEVKEGVRRFDPSFITFSGSGEPLLYSRIGEMIDEIKKLFPEKKICLLTHAPFLEKKEIRKELLNLDVFSPSLDAGTEKTFLKINRPHPDIKFENVKEGLLKMKEEFKGEYHLEIMYIEGLNDREEDIKGIKEFVQKLNPDRIFVNTPIRPPAEEWVNLPSYERVIEFAKRISERVEIVYLPCKTQNKGIEKFEEIIEAIKRRPYEFQEIKELTGLKDGILRKKLKKEIEKGKIYVKKAFGSEYYYYRKKGLKGN